MPLAKKELFDLHIREHNPKYHANTRVELQRQIEEWTNDGKWKSIFWLNGIASTRKSTIAQKMAQLFTKEKQLSTSILLKKGKSNHDTASSFVTTIITDLAAYVSELIPDIIKAIHTDLAISKKT